MRWWGWLLHAVLAFALCTAMEVLRVEAATRTSSNGTPWLDWMSVPVWFYAIAAVWGGFILLLRKGWRLAEKVALRFFDA